MNFPYFDKHDNAQGFNLSTFLHFLIWYLIFKEFYPVAMCNT